VRRLRYRLIAAFLAATALPLAATVWIATSLLDRSLSYSPTGELDRLSRTLEGTARQFYQREREILKADVSAGRLTPTRYTTGSTPAWPEPIRAFWDSGEAERFELTGDGGDHVVYLRRADGDAPAVDAYTRDLRGIKMEELSTQFRDTRSLVASLTGRDLRRGLTLTLLLLLATVWIISLAPLYFIAHRISQPIQELTAGLTGFAAGDWSRRITNTRDDEVGRAVDAFNHMAEQLRHSRERLVHLTQMASWQSLARKTAHELKNSLTPIRLTVEEMVARQPASADRQFMAQAAQIVVSEIDTLERRVRAFSEFASEPPVDPEAIDLHQIVHERVALLKASHAATRFELQLAEGPLVAWVTPDLVKGLLTNLLQNAGEAAGPEGTVLVTSGRESQDVVVEIHDSGSGLSAEAARTLFEPTITFKRHGMGLGLSIARNNAVRSGGDIQLVDGRCGGAGFRVILPTPPTLDEKATIDR
jgi:two-component system nitrogen regulation sensor histidine kinase NtrY